MAHHSAKKFGQNTYIKDTQYNEHIHKATNILLQAGLGALSLTVIELYCSYVTCIYHI